MRSATGCALSPANVTHLYLLYMTEKTIKRQPGGVSIRTGFTVYRVLAACRVEFLLFVGSRTGKLARAISSTSKPSAPPVMMVRPLGAIPANFPRGNTPPLPPFDGPPFPFELPAYADWLYSAAVRMDREVDLDELALMLPTSSGQLKSSSLGVQSRQRR